MRQWFRRLIVRAAPSCTLWRALYHVDCLEFILWPKWKISGIELVEAGA